MNKRILKIIITKQYCLQCLLVDSKNHQNIIQLKENQNEIIPSLSFDDSRIIISGQQEQSIHFIKDLFDKPNEYKKYNFIYLGKEYSVIAEVLFGIIIDAVKRKIEKEWIIELTARITSAVSSIIAGVLPAPTPNAGLPDE